MSELDTDILEEQPIFPRIMAILIYLCGALVFWMVLAALRGLIILRMTNLEIPIGEALQISFSFFRIEAAAIIFWLLIESGLRWKFIRFHEQRRIFIGGVFRTIQVAVPSSLIGIIIFWSLKTPEKNRHYHSSAVSRAVVSEKISLKIFPRAVQRVSTRSNLSDRGIQAADSAVLGQLIATTLIAIIGYIRFGRQEMLRKYPVLEKATSYFDAYQKRNPIRGGGLNDG